jgi:phosphatidate cytidylyltransferase
VSELKKRLAVAAVGVPILTVLLLSGARASALVFSAAGAIGSWEFVRLGLGGVPLLGWVGVAAAAVLPLLPAYLAGPEIGAVAFLVLGAASMLLWSVALFSAERGAAPARVGHVLAGVLFTAIGMVALSALRAGREGTAWTFAVLVTTWTNDAFAYFGGRALGRHKLWPAVSPKKTWEGLAIGFLGGVLGMLVIRRWLPRDMTTGLCVSIGVAGGLLAPLGDLCKSMVKRAYHVKDAGRLLPGHGGMLDRIDGVLFVAPVVWLIRAAWFGR